MSDPQTPPPATRTDPATLRVLVETHARNLRDLAADLRAVAGESVGSLVPAMTDAGVRSGTAHLLNTCVTGELWSLAQQVADAAERTTGVLAEISDVDAAIFEAKSVTE